MQEITLEPLLVDNLFQLLNCYHLVARTFLYECYC